jgi:hypothetical protein
MFRKVLFALFVVAALTAGAAALIGLTPARALACDPVSGLGCN